MTGRLPRAWLASRLTMLAALLFSWPVWAHEQKGQAAGFAKGPLHPVSGLDHVMAMVAVGLWGAHLGAPAIGLRMLGLVPQRQVLRPASPLLTP
jgi:hydrogenase/urease accessory protein HupE